MHRRCSRADIGADHTIHIFRGMADPGKMAEQAFRDVKKKKLFHSGSYAKMCHVAAKILPAEMDDETVDDPAENDKIKK